MIIFMIFLFSSWLSYWDLGGKEVYEEETEDLF